MKMRRKSVFQGMHTLTVPPPPRGSNLFGQDKHEQQQNKPKEAAVMGFRGVWLLVIFTLLPVTSFVLPSQRLLPPPASGSASHRGSVRRRHDVDPSASVTTISSSRRDSMDTDVLMELEATPLDRR